MWELVKYEGIGPILTTVLFAGTDLAGLYAARDLLDEKPRSLAEKRHGVRPVEER